MLHRWLLDHVMKCAEKLQFERHEIKFPLRVECFVGQSLSRGTFLGKVSDSYHSVLIEYTNECVSRFERKYRIRLTDETVKSIIKIQKSRIVFLKRNEILEKCDSEFELENTSVRLALLICEDMEVIDTDYTKSLSQYPPDLVYADELYISFWKKGFFTADQLSNFEGQFEL